MSFANLLIGDFTDNAPAALASVGVGHFIMKGDKRGRCRQCAKDKKRREILYKCRQCNVFLCPDCFQPYHHDLLRNRQKIVLLAKFWAVCWPIFIEGCMGKKSSKNKQKLKKKQKTIIQKKKKFIKYIKERGSRFEPCSHPLTFVNNMCSIAVDQCLNFVVHQMCLLFFKRNLKFSVVVFCSTVC